MSATEHAQPQASATPTKRTIDTTLDRAIVAYSVACREAHTFTPGSEPLLIPYLAGWGCRDMGMAALEKQQLGVYCKSWRLGWRDCDAYLELEARYRSVGSDEGAKHRGR
jgi:hypothetical protein